MSDENKGIIPSFKSQLWCLFWFFFGGGGYFGQRFYLHNMLIWIPWYLIAYSKFSLRCQYTKGQICATYHWDKFWAKIILCCTRVKSITTHGEASHVTAKCPWHLTTFPPCVHLLISSLLQHMFPLYAFNIKKNMQFFGGTDMCRCDPTLHFSSKSCKHLQVNE